MFFKIRINDYTGSGRSVTLPQAYPDPRQAASVGWGITAAIAALNGLDYENQGDQYMAFYKDGEQAGEGAYTVEIIDEYNQPIEDI